MRTCETESPISKYLVRIPVAWKLKRVLRETLIVDNPACIVPVQSFSLAHQIFEVNDVLDFKHIGELEENCSNSDLDVNVVEMERRSLNVRDSPHPIHSTVYPILPQNRLLHGLLNLQIQRDSSSHNPTSRKSKTLIKFLDIPNQSCLP